jgi:hypothetical protein
MAVMVTVIRATATQNSGTTRLTIIQPTVMARGATTITMGTMTMGIIVTPDRANWHGPAA